MGWRRAVAVSLVSFGLVKGNKPRCHLKGWYPACLDDTEARDLPTARQFFAEPWKGYKTYLKGQKGLRTALVASGQRIKLWRPSLVATCQMGSVRILSEVAWSKVVNQNIRWPSAASVVVFKF